MSLPEGQGSRKKSSTALRKKLANVRRAASGREETSSDLLTTEKDEVLSQRSVAGTNSAQGDEDASFRTY